MTEREIEPAPATEALPVPAIAVPAEELPAPPVVQDDPGPSRVGCRTELHGWAGGHLHGAVRPRRRAAGRGRPPGRWC
ncbi:hypothetical protein [Actinoplanes sp. M2I2]|uniref:hypothetical protein n=1 Tax=Actinoplanes sp. M2I2 TaxID=1734444 RepID=UPI00201FF8E2|nr:hypothetical protein [Actinoplanes sp. M2I2]